LGGSELLGKLFEEEQPMSFDIPPAFNVIQLNVHPFNHFVCNEGEIICLNIEVVVEIRCPSTVLTRNRLAGERWKSAILSLHLYMEAEKVLQLQPVCSSFSIATAKNESKLFGLLIVPRESCSLPQAFLVPSVGDSTKNDCI
jgi:hypothetical protein